MRLILLWLTGLSTATALTHYRFEEPCMGTVFTIEVYAESEDAIQPTIEKAWKRAHELDAIFSDYNPGSEVSILMRESEGKPIPVSPELFGLLEESQKLHQLTDGDFDITLGPLKRLWNQSRRDGRLPKEAKIARARSLTGPKRFTLAERKAKVTTGTRLDFGGIAKGYAADELLALLKKNGFPIALVAASGDLAIGDAPPGKKGWRIGIESLASPTEPDKFLILKNRGVSTSGDTAQFVEIDGQRYSHILDPATGLGLTTRRSVTVIAARATRSDALATAVSVAGSEAEWLDELSDAIDFRIVTTASEGFRETHRGSVWKASPENEGNHSERTKNPKP
jgi:thiamine biosynthesis lipoprotein